MFDRNPIHLMCAIGLAVAGAVATQGALAHGGMDHDMMEKMDANHDGMISAQEHADYARMKFARMDTNHDGMLSAAEMEAAHDMHHEDKDGDEHEKHEGKDNDEHEHGDHEHGDSRDMHGDMMARLDTNHDGMVSAAEFSDHMKSMFDKADANHDGMLSKDEIRAAHEMRDEKHERHEDRKEKHEDRKESKEDDVKAP